MPFLSSSNNAILVDNCQNLQNLTITLEVTEDLVTVGDTGFSLQLNTYPQTTSKTLNFTPQTGDNTMTWIQYVLYVQNNQVTWQIQPWANNAHSVSEGPPKIVWPPGYTPNPPNTTPWLPVFPGNTGSIGEAIPGASAPSNRVPAGSVIAIQLATDTAGNVTGAGFTITDPSGVAHSDTTQPFNTYAGAPEPANYAEWPIYGFTLNIVGPGNLAPCTFTSGAGTLTYKVSPPGALSLQSSATASCQGRQPPTGETSNAVYGDITGSPGSTVSQTLNVNTMGMEFDILKGTFGKDEVTQQSSWAPAFWLAVSGFPNAQLGFNKSSDLDTFNPLRPLPALAISVDKQLNGGLTGPQLATIADPKNLPQITFGPLPVLAIDDQLQIDYQTLFYPYTIAFPNENAFNTLDPHQVAVLTLTASLTVQVPTGNTTDSKGNLITTYTPVPVSCTATLVLAKGEDPYFSNFNPTHPDPQAYPPWLSFDLRLFSATPEQSHQMFSVSNPTNSSDAIRYIRDVLNHLNNPSLITNGDTFDATLTQDEDKSKVDFYPNDNSFVPTFTFAVARVRVLSSISITLNNVRVFFRLFNAASTSSEFTEVGTGEGYYRWGSNGTTGHKIPLLGVRGAPFFGMEYVTVPCFATERVNLNQPADMKTQTDPPNAPPPGITTAAGSEVDTYFGCWLDVNQLTPFLIPTPPGLLPSQWDGPWTPTESLNGAISVAPHQCLVAEIRFDDTPIPNGATISTSNQLAQRNIAWIDGPK
jgi:hypothetical protein